MRAQEDGSGNLLTGPDGNLVLGFSADIIDELIFDIVAVGGRVIATFGPIPDPAVEDDRVDYFITLLGEIEGQLTGKPFLIRGVRQGTYDIGSAAQVLGPFASTPWASVLLGVKFENSTDLVPVRKLVVSPASPSAPNFTTAPGPNPGEIVVTLLDPYPTSGDGNTAGDGLGGALTMKLLIGNEDVVDLDDGDVAVGEPITIDRTPGELVLVALRADSAFREGSPSVTLTVTATEEPEPVDPPTWIPQPAIDAVAGDTLALDLSTMFIGADSFAASGIDGATLSGTGDKDYEVVLTEGTFTLAITGTSTETGLSSSGTISVTVEAAAVLPVWGAITDVVATQGDSPRTRNLANFITAGTTPITYAAPGDAGSSLYALSGSTITVATDVATDGPVTVDVEATNAAGTATSSFTVTINELTSVPPTLLVGSGADVYIQDSSFVFGGSKWRKPNVRIPGLLPGHTPQWSTDLPDPDTGLIDESKWETFEAPVSGIYVPEMTDPAANGDPDGQSPRLDYSCYSSSQVTKAGRFVVRQVNDSTGVASLPSAKMNVPLVSVSDPQVTWLQAVLRRQLTFNASVVGNTGQQFERAGCWNQGKLDLDKMGHWFGVQDENNIWACHNGTETDSPALFGSPRQEGLWGSNGAGIYANSDDNIVIAVVSGGEDGVYRSTDWCDRFYKIPMNRPGKPDASGSTVGFTNVVNGSSSREAQNCIWRRPQHFIDDVPQLSDAERPIWIIEQKKAGGNIPTDVFIWKSVDNGESFTCVLQLSNPSQYIGPSKTDTIKFIDVAPNGDVMFCSSKGVWLSTNEFATQPTKLQVLGNTSNRNIVAIGWRGGDVNTVSGAYAAIRSSSNGGVVRTGNVRTTGFTRPSGQDGAIASYSCNNMDVSPVNSDRLWICGGGVNPKISTDGGVTFRDITDRAGTGDGAGRYAIKGDSAQFWAHPWIEDIVMAEAGQTMTRSVDGGSTFDGDLCAYFDGSHDKGWGFDGTGQDWQKICFMQQDYALRYGDAGLDYFFDSQVNKGSPISGGPTLGDVMLRMATSNNWNYTSGQLACFLTDTRILVGMNRGTGSGRNCFVIEENPRPASSTPNNQDDIGQMQDYIIKESFGTSRCAYSRPHPTNHDMVFAGRARVTNLDAPTLEGVQFDNMVRQIVDIFQLGAQIISYWAADGNDTTAIHRSTADNGGNHQLWASVPTSRVNAIAPDPFVAERVLYARNNQNGVIREIVREGGNLVDRELVNLRTGLIIPYLNNRLGAGTYDLPSTPITSMCADPNMQGLYYAVVNTHGAPVLFRTIDDGETWEDITEDLPRTDQKVIVHPLTGDVICASSKGRRVHPPPVGYPNIPNKGALSAQVLAYMNRPEIPFPVAF